MSKKDLLIVLFIFVGDVILETKLFKRLGDKINKHQKECEPKIKKGVKDE